ncbi:hypothetical protein [Polymorphospora rubra]|uniref:DUF4126 domain-containing protein n=1 Tax=Polymorphospora rubra TaxID=338584 RepID=A0A810N612_9ACTN|nr:hypothetical protein [Polymorphospora rubra]BCJ68737.1 hypothetical protein Prubr_57580 [Polymorphospora rubra]
MKAVGTVRRHAPHTGRHVADGHRRGRGTAAGAATAWRAVALGAATGGRSMTGLAAVTLTTPGTSTRHRRRARIAALLAAAGEIVADKSPRTPSRLDPAPLAGRLGTGVLAAVLLARRNGSRPLIPVLLACAGVVAASVAGATWRAYASRRGHPALAALAEDVVTVGLATAAVHGTGHRIPGRRRGHRTPG